jgi:hypothetical protein
MTYLKKPLLLLLLCTIVFASCKKGKKMPEPVGVAIDFSNTELHINNHPDQFYIAFIDEEELMYMFADDLADALGENNVYIDEVNPKYVIKVKELTVRETHNNHYYTDDCTFETVNYPTATVHFDSEVVLFSTGADNSSLATINESMNRREEIRNATNDDECLDIRINEIQCDVNCMSEKIAKRLRKHITKKIYRAEGF